MKANVDTQLFLGGPAHGQRKAIQFGIRAVFTDHEGKFHHYSRQEFAGEKTLFAFWLHEGTSVDDGLGRLFEGQPAKELTPDRIRLAQLASRDSSGNMSEFCGATEWQIRAIWEALTK